MSARFQEQDVNSGLKHKRVLSSFLDNRVRFYRSGVGKISLTYIFCTDEFLLGLNQQFLDHDTLTDIITFDLSEKDTANLIGEIYVSMERVRENAVKYSVSVEDELLRVICHGMLHLCGFGDKKKSDIVQMRAQEDLCIKGYKQYLQEYATRSTI
jgi:probable rRNA maturation factor